MLVFIVVMFKNHISEGRQVPLATWMGVIFGIVCLFRVVFCFIYVDDGFSDLAEYVVFEIPTFLLFTGVILVTAMFMKLSKKKFASNTPLSFPSQIENWLTYFSSGHLISHLTIEN